MAINIDHQNNKIKSGNSDNITIDNVGSIIIPKGTTGQRPVSGLTAGCFRFNTTTGKMELYDGSAWSDVTTSATSTSGNAIVFSIIFGS